MGAANSESMEQEKFYVTAGGGSMMECDLNIGVGGACFRVPVHLDYSVGVRVTVDDLSRQRVGGMVKVGNGFYWSDWFCGEWVGPAAAGGTVRVDLDVPAVDEACIDSEEATSGSVTARFFPTD